MSAKVNLLLLKAIIETELPALLVTAGVDALDEYVLGSPTDSEIKSIGFYLGPGNEDVERVNFKPVIQLQLKSVNYEDSLVYFDVVFDLLDSINSKRIGMLDMEQISYTEYPPDETGTTVFSFYIDYKLMLDDCD